ncbi:hypothetical protein [Paenibacillus methanolicus]|uniref:Uncharacterized protein n=1 Tax=Paenibacillus methanolicus TaxID=582686 RepID=A0A5S5C9N5_9BACL|nr:hypothetical protein [Paenibacillus methanolicus]TYP74703.1 hypothetical protein BCM02_105247 [Paenibacillus methanolicus]
MNKRIHLKNAALSALLLTSLVAVPAATSADAGNQSQAAQPSAPTKAAEKRVIRFGAADPLALAKRYAPETTAEWERVLNAYKEAGGFALPGNMRVGKAAAIEGSDTLLKSDEIGDAVIVHDLTQSGEHQVTVRFHKAPAQVGDQDVLTEPALQITKANEAEKIGDAVHIVKIKEDGSIAGGAGMVKTAIPLDEAAIAKLKELKGAEFAISSPIGEHAEAIRAETIAIDSAAEGAGGVKIKIKAFTEADKAFFEARAELAEAAASEDAAAIKAALAELLDQYEAQTEELKANPDKAALAVPAAKALPATR